MRRRVVVAVSLLLAGASAASVACTACTAKKPTPPAESKKVASGANGAASAPKLVPHPLTGPRQPGVISRLAPIAADEVRALLPSPTGARVLAKVDHAAIGQRVEGAWCYDSGSLADLGAALAREYEAAGWTGFVVHPDPNLPDRATVTAAKPPYLLFGQLAKSGRDDCRGVDGKTYVSLGVHHVEAVAPGGGPGAAAAGAQGTTGLRGP
jgi:hypothetical protein